MPGVCREGLRVASESAALLSSLPIEFFGVFSLQLLAGFLKIVHKLLIISPKLLPSIIE